MALQQQLQSQLQSSAYGFNQDTLMQDATGMEHMMEAVQPQIRVKLDTFNSDLNLTIDEDG
jgi:hypothetical protein